jgi:euchromatic histone-lysine N-methyltransferase
MNENTLNGVAGVHEFEECEITTTMDILESTNTSDGAVDAPELEKGEIAATMDIVESMNIQSLDGVVVVQKVEEGVIADTMNIVDPMNNQSLNGVVVVQKLEESKISAIDTVEGIDKDTIVPAAEDRELDVEIAAKGHGPEPDEGETAAKGHGQEPGDSEIATESDNIAHQSVNVIPCGSTSGIIRSKIRLTPRKTVRPPIYMSQLVTLDRPFSTTTATMNKFKEAQTKPVKANQTMSQLVPLDRPFFTTTAAMKKFKAAETKPVTVNLAFASASASKEKRKFKFMIIDQEKLKGKRAVYLEDDDILKAVSVHEGKLELCLGCPSCVLSVRHHRQHGGQNADPRRRVRMMCRRFEFLCRFLAKAVKQGSMELRRVDLAADQIIKKLPDYIKHGPTVGEVAGVEVGDQFLFRVELAIVGLHGPYRAGIDTTKDRDGELIAISIIASGGYLDEFSNSGDLVYTGSGGKAAGGADQDGDQKLHRGNLALKNCIKREIPVRVTHGFKSQNADNHSKGKEISKFIYDGLYHVVGIWQEGIPGSRVFKYRLRRIPGQPKLPLHVAKWLRKSAHS